MTHNGTSSRLAVMCGFESWSYFSGPRRVICVIYALQCFMGYARGSKGFEKRSALMQERPHGISKI